MRYLLQTAILSGALAFSQSSAPASAPVRANAQLAEVSEAVRAASSEPLKQDEPLAPAELGAPVTVLMRTGNWFVYAHGCDTVRHRRDVVIHFHGAHTTVIPRFVASGLNAVLVIVNLGLFSGPYTDAFALRASVDGLIERIQHAIDEKCGVAGTSSGRIALSSWSAGYGAVEQFLRWRPERIDAVLLADGLHVGFSDRRARVVNLNSLDAFVRFAHQAVRGEKLMSITHSGIVPSDYASTSETAMAMSLAAHAPTWTVDEQKHGMRQLTASRRGEFYVEGFSGNDKPAHAQHLYSIDKTSFARLREYWKKR